MRYLQAVKHVVYQRHLYGVGVNLQNKHGGPQGGGMAPWSAITSVKIPAGMLQGLTLTIRSLIIDMAVIIVMGDKSFDF